MQNLADNKPLTAELEKFFSGENKPITKSDLRAIENDWSSIKVDVITKKDLSGGNKPITKKDLSGENKPITKEDLEEALAPIKLNVSSPKVDVSSLVAANPQAAMAKMKVPVVQQNDKNAVIETILDGAFTTWTYMTGYLDGQQVLLAVSCAHCALGNNLEEPPRSFEVFVSLPSELAQLGVEWVGLLDDFLTGPDANGKHPVGRDIAVVCLKKFPTDVDPAKAVKWPTNLDTVLNQRGFSNAVVAGRSKAGIVSRSCCAVKRESREQPYICYIQDSSEQGTSGTGMMLLHTDSEEGANEVVAMRGARALGVKKGNYTFRGKEALMKKRGVICPFPGLFPFSRYMIAPESRLPDEILLHTGYTDIKKMRQKVNATYRKVVPDHSDLSLQYYQKLVAENRQKEYGIIVTKEQKNKPSLQAVGAIPTKTYNIMKFVASPLCCLLAMIVLLSSYQSEAFSVEKPASAITPTTTTQQPKPADKNQQCPQNGVASWFPQPSSSSTTYLAVITEPDACASDQRVEETLAVFQQILWTAPPDLISVRVNADSQHNRVVRLIASLVQMIQQQQQDTASPSTRVVVTSDWVDAAIQAKAHGIHVKESHRTKIPAIRQAFQQAGSTSALPPALIGTSAHSVESALNALVQHHPDYFFVGTCYVTQTHPEKGSDDVEGPSLPGMVRHAMEEHSRHQQQQDSKKELPVVLAIGGIDATNCHEPVALGAHGVATIRAILQAKDPIGVVKDMRMAMTRANLHKETQ